MNLFNDFLRRAHNHKSDVRQQRNQTALSTLDDGSANKEHIEQRTLAKIEAARLVKIAARRMKEDRQKCEAAIEMYLDDWVFQNGPITKENVVEAMADCVDRIKRRTQAVQSAREHAEDSDGMKDFPF